jgi:hypothetical protein
LVLDQKNLSPFLRPFFFFKTGIFSEKTKPKINKYYLTLVLHTIPGKAPSFHFQYPSAPSSQLESAPHPLPDSGRGGSPETGHLAEQP